MSIRTYEKHIKQANCSAGLVLLASLFGVVDDGAVILAGTGVPSGDTYGGQTLATDQIAVAIRADATSADACLYLTVDGGTSWTALKPGGLNWYDGTITNPAADDATGVHASNDDDTQAWPGPITSPTSPRNVTVTFGAAWAGGDVTFTGTDQFDVVITEVIADVAGTLVAGVKIFKSITGIAHELAGAGGAGHGATAGWGHKLGVDYELAAQLGILTVDGVTEHATWDSTYHAFNPTSLPDGTHDYTWAVAT